jgi:hypothetical protein
MKKLKNESKSLEEKEERNDARGNDTEETSNREKRRKV